MIAISLLLSGGVIAIITRNSNVLLAVMFVSIIVLDLKFMFHGYQIKKLKERMYGETKYEF